MKRRRVENFIGTTRYKYHSTGNHYPSAYKIMIMIIVAMLASILLYYNIDIYLVILAIVGSSSSSSSSSSGGTMYNGCGWDLLTPGTGLIICQDHYYTSGWSIRGHRHDEYYSSAYGVGVKRMYT